MRIIICDDEQTSIIQYKENVKKLAAKHKINITIEEFVSGEQLIFELSENPNCVDLIYMDINFQEKMDGILATKKLRELGYKNEIIFLTIDKSRVFDSFDVEPLNYIVKNITDIKKFEKIFLTAAGRISEKQKEFIALSCAGDNRNIAIDSIHHFEVVRRIIEVHYDEEVFEFYSTIGKLENLLFDKGFIRVHRAYLVSVSHIASVKSGELTLNNGDVLPIGRTYMKNVKDIFNAQKAI